MMETFGSRLKHLRDSKHLRQEQIAELIGVDKTTVSCYENDTRQPSYTTLIRIATIFNVTTDYLLGINSPDTLNVSGLTPSDKVLVENIIQVLSEKNKRLQAYDQNFRYQRKGYDK